MPVHLQTDQGSETAYDNKQVGTLNSKQDTPLILGGRTVDCRLAECANVLSHINPGRELSTPRSAEGKTLSVTPTMLCLYQALHARKVCVQLPGILRMRCATCPYYRNQLREMFVKVPGILMNEIHVPGVLPYEPQMHILEMKPRDPSPHVP